MLEGAVGVSEQTKVKLFREKSLEAVESPESLNDYPQLLPGLFLSFWADSS